MAQRIEVKQKEGEEVPAEVMAQAIVDIAAGMKKIAATRLNRKALLVLLSHATQLPQHRVEVVLNALEQLEDLYCKKASR